MLNIIITIILLCLTACSEEADLSTPAQKQIDEYNKQLEMCPENTESNNDDKTKISEQTKSIENQEQVIQQENQKVIPDSDLDIDNQNSQLENTQSTINALIVKHNQPDLKSKHVNDISLGHPNASVTIIEYFSPTCPGCAYYKQKVFPRIKELYIDTNKITYVMREFIANKQDLDASILARCSGNMNDFLNFIEVLLNRQNSWVFTKKYREILTNIGQLGGISPERYTKCLNDDSIKNILITNTKVATKSPQFIGTPTLFINGIQFNEAHSIEEISKAIDKVISVQQ